MAQYDENKEDNKEMKAQTIILGNVITMDEFKPYAEAIAVMLSRRLNGALSFT